MPSFDCALLLFAVTDTDSVAPSFTKLDGGAPPLDPLLESLVPHICPPLADVGFPEFPCTSAPPALVSMPSPRLWNPRCAAIDIPCRCPPP